VCALDPFCCDTAWDGICASEAQKLCEVCGVGPSCPDCAEDLFPVGAGDGVVGAGDLGQLLSKWGPCPGCCEDLAPVGSPDGVVGAADLGQLLSQWGPCDTGGLCPPSKNDCCVANGTPGCADTACCEAVCAIDAFCCDTAWDSICAGEAADTPICNCGGGACPPSSNDCCAPGTGPGCSDTACCESVCALDAFCCDTAWDGICAGEAQADPNCNCGGGKSNCCTANGGLGCDDAACEATVCAVDSFCCQVAWDSICASEAQDLCGNLCGGGGASNCCEANGGLGCDDPTCEAAVCAVDSFCCDVAWDSICAGEAGDLCAVCQ
jgi:hypothetical protein